MTLDFKSIIGHEAQTEYLARVVERGTLAHAYCFSGPKGVGKGAVAREFVRGALKVEKGGNGQRGEERGEEGGLVIEKARKGGDGGGREEMGKEGLANEVGVGKEEFANEAGVLAIGKVGKGVVGEEKGKCDFAVSDQVLSANPDITIVKPSEKGSISVDDIRNLRERLSMFSFGKSKKIAIIEDAEAMTIAAQNALLKTLEEPSGDTLIILITSDASELRSTITSRTVHIRFTLVEREKICSFLSSQNLTKDLAHELAGLAAGRPGIAMSLIDKETRDQARGRINETLNFLESPLADKFGTIEKLSKDKDRTTADVIVDLQRLRLVVHDCLLASAGSENLISLSSTVDRIGQISSSRTSQAWAETLKSINAAELAIKQNVNAKLAMESVALKC
ncbi:MAG: hypothetical protein ABIA47_01915 [bacterium]